MAGKITRTIALVIILAEIVVMALKVQNVEANGTIFIRADGSVIPPETPILSVDNETYMFLDDVYGSIDVERNNIIIDGAGYILQGSGDGNGITLSERENVTIKNLDIKDFDKGVYLNDSSGSTISRCRIRNNRYGIHLSGSSSNTIYENNVTANSQYGVLIVLLSAGNLVFGNNIADNAYGFRLDYSSESNTIVANNVVSNQIGIVTIFSSNNHIFHNNFVDNTAQALTESSLNVWDDGYPSGGNYWSDYGIKYPDAAEIDDSGIWNTPYSIDTGTADNYPLMMPVPPQDTTPPTIVIISPGNSTYASNVQLIFTVSEAASWTAYSLDNGSNVVITGNTSLTLSEGSHSIAVRASDSANNVGSSGRVYFTVDNTPPSITQIVQSPAKENVYYIDKVKVNATIADALAGVKQVTLNYTTNNVTWVSILMTNIGGNVFNATIPEFPADTSVNYVIKAEDNVGNINVSEKMGYVCQDPVIPEFASVMSLLSFMIVTLAVAIVCKRKYSR